MALDWSKDISFSGLLKKKPKKKVVYPSKRYINLMPRKESNNDARKVIPVALLLILLVAAFVKFGIYDLYDHVYQKQKEVAQQELILKDLEVQTADYDQVKEEYDAYVSTELTVSSTDVSATEAMALVDKHIAPVASIESVKYEENTITLSLNNISLDAVGALVSTLYEQDIVANVTVSTAAAEETSGSEDQTATMVITVQKV